MTEHPSCVCVLSGDADPAVAGLSLEGRDGVRRRWRFGDVAQLASFVPGLLADDDERPVLLVPPRASADGEAMQQGPVRLLASPRSAVERIVVHFDGVHVMPPSVQSSGLAELGFSFGGYCGSDFRREAAGGQVTEIGVAVGEWLRWRGRAGVVVDRPALPANEVEITGMPSVGIRIEPGAIMARLAALHSLAAANGRSLTATAATMVGHLLAGFSIDTARQPEMS